MPEPNRKFNRVIQIRVGEKAYNEFEEACKFNYQSKSGVLRKFIADYIRHYKYEKQKLKD